MNIYSDKQESALSKAPTSMDLCILLLLLSLLSVLSSVPLEVEAKPVKSVSGEHVFRQYCSTCHLNGGNRIKPSRPIAESSQLSSLPKFKSYLEVPPGHMPHFENVVKDQKVLNSLYAYCKTLKKPIKQAHLNRADLSAWSAF